MRARSVVTASLAAALAVPGAASATPADAALRAARSLASHQRPDGAFAPRQPADYVAEEAAAILAGGLAGAPVERALAYVRAHGPARAKERAGAAGRIALALVAAGKDPRSFGFDYVAQLASFYNPVSGAYDAGNEYANALAVLGVLAAREPLPAQALTHVRAARCRDGGFAAQVPCLSGEVDTTALVLNVFALAGEGTDAAARAWLRSAQNGDGGWGASAGARTNANSTGLALSAIAAIGERVTGWTSDGGDPLRALLGLQEPSGRFRWRADADQPGDYATVQAIPGLVGMAYPVRAPSAAAPPPARTVSEPPAAAASGSPAPVRAGAYPGPCAGETRRPRTGRAGLVVMFGDGRVRERCVAFREPSISGLDLLRRSGVGVVYEGQALGALVCAIGGEGSRWPREPCVGTGAFWGYYVRDAASGGWVFSDLGASARLVRDGDVQGWRWGDHGARACPPDPGVRACGRPARQAAARDAPARPPGAGLAASAAVLVGLVVWGARLSRARRREGS